MAIEQVCDEALVPFGHVLFQRFLTEITRFLADVLHRDHGVDTVRLAADVLIDPCQLFFELLRTVRDSAQHTKAARAADGCNDVTTVTERKDWKLDPQTFG